MSATPRPTATSQRRPFYRRKAFLWPVGTILALLVVTTAAIALSPDPGALLIRSVFEDNSTKVKAALEAHAPEGIASITNEQYRAGDKDALLDVYFSDTVAADSRQPTVVWIHGGAWISGSKDDAVPYFQLIAAEGYTVVAVNYSLAPEKTYPTAVHQLNDAFAYLQENAERFHIDIDNFVIAGDSAGSQLTSQIATLVTNPDYAAQMGITPSLQPAQLKGVVLNCGIYDAPNLWGAGSGLIGWGDTVALWAYTGDRSKDGNKALDEMSTVNYVTSAFPPAFITGGNADPLTDVQSKPFAEKLESLGVETTTLFYPADHEPALAHEYQFNLDNDDGQKALAAILEFIKSHVD
ncbi:MAG: alpha/beta hydrolase [Thermomicrobiales bacterium]